MSPKFEIIVGTYEEFLLGYNFYKKSLEIKQSFAAHDHTSSIRCITFSDNLLASGGTDDRIFIYDLKTRKEYCSLTHHNASITCLQFTNNHSHLISGSADGVLSIVRVGNWQLEKLWEKAHKGAIKDIAVHSSGKLALTLGDDCCLCTWNLIKGRQAYVINLKSKCEDPKNLEKILWAPDDIRFILYGGKFIDIWNIEVGGVINSIKLTCKVTSCIWLNNEEILIGYEDGKISLYCLKTNNYSIVKQGHDSRIKSLYLYKKWIISISSDGKIKIWENDLTEIKCFDCGCRLTCLQVVPSYQISVKQEKDESIEINKSINSKLKKRKLSTAKVLTIIENDDDDDKNEFIQIKKKKKNKTNKRNTI